MATYRRPDWPLRSSITLKNTERIYCLLFVCILNLNIAFACFDLKYFPGEKSRAFQMTRVPCHFTIKECKFKMEIDIRYDFCQSFVLQSSI